jgi:deoxyribose-phosphate aldolase
MDFSDLDAERAKMTIQITSKFEIEIGGMNQRELMDAGIFALKHRCQALVVPSVAVQGAIVDRSTRDGQYKIVAAVDFPAGSQFALDKLRDIPQDAFDADGFEIVLSRNRGEANCKNEIRAITDLIKRFNPLAEVRFVLNVFSRNDVEIKACCQEFKTSRPAFVRLEASLIVVPAITAITAAVERIRADAPNLVKVCGLPKEPGEQLQKAEALLKIPGVVRIGVSLDQARSILRMAQEAQNKPPQEPAKVEETQKAPEQIDAGIKK